MTDKETFDLMEKHGINAMKGLTEEEHLENLVDKLLDALYIPTEDGFGLDPKRLEHFGIDKDEPVNWGSLGCSVGISGDSFSVLIEEAAPDECPTLCGYVERNLRSRGWDNIVVNTEW